MEEDLQEPPPPKKIKSWEDSETFLFFASHRIFKQQ